MKKEQNKVIIMSVSTVWKYINTDLANQLWKWHVLGSYHESHTGKLQVRERDMASYQLLPWQLITGTHIHRYATTKYKDRQMIGYTCMSYQCQAMYISNRGKFEHS